jgi:hypothetical protein
VLFEEAPTSKIKRAVNPFSPTGEAAHSSDMFCLIQGDGQASQSLPPPVPKCKIHDHLYQCRF